MRREQDNLKAQYRDLQTQVKDTNQRLKLLQSLAGEVATAYGIARFHQTPFGLTDAAAAPDTDAVFQQSLNEFSYLEKNASAVTLLSGGMRVLPGTQLGSLGIAPALWPVVGEITGHFGRGLIPSAVRVHSTPAWTSRRITAMPYALPPTALFPRQTAAPGMAGDRDHHGFGVTTWYGHLSAFNTQPGTHVKAGDIIGYEGQSGRSTGPHLHYEVRIYNTPVNPWRYLRNLSPSTTVATTTASNTNGD